MELTRGTLVTPKVRLSRPLGGGAMGTLWVADHLELNQEVAVKFIADRVSKSAATIARFKREAKAAVQLQSRHVVRIFDYGGMGDGLPYIVMELLEGESLGDRLQREGKLAVTLVRDIVDQVSEALGEAHERDIVHRDIKPDNIFLVPPRDSPLVKVLDFGMAKQTTVTGGSIVTATGVIVGTPEYMSPEQILGSKNVDQRADLWALGVVAYRALTGEIPFTSPTPHALIFAICKAEFQPASEKGAPPRLDDWFKRALSPDVKGRFSSAREMSEAFAEATAGLDISDEPTVLVPPEVLEQRLAREAGLDAASQADTVEQQLAADAQLAPGTAAQPPGVAGDEPATERCGPPQSLRAQPEAEVQGGVEDEVTVEEQPKAGGPGKIEPPSGGGDFERTLELAEGVATAGPGEPADRDTAVAGAEERPGQSSQAGVSVTAAQELIIRHQKGHWRYVLGGAVIGVAALIAIAVLVDPLGSASDPAAQPLRPPGPLHRGSAATATDDEAPAASGPAGGQPTGLLSIVCQPWCDEVFVGDRSLGSSPITKLALAPGRHRLVLKKQGSAAKIIQVDIVAGQELTRHVDLDAQAPDAAAASASATAEPAASSDKWTPLAP